MKRCPECGREYDNTMVFCLDDGSELLYGPASGSGAGDEPATAILHSTAAPGEAPTRAQIHTTEQTAVLPSGISEDLETKGFDKRLILAPLALAVIVLGGFFGYRYLSSGSASASIDSIAVLPFQNVSGDPNLEYLSDGIAESLINSLTQLQQLKVIARNTAFRYKGKDVDAEQIGKDLGVHAILAGRVRQSGDRLNIQVDLVDAVTGAQLWGEEFERPVTDALSIKQAIAREVTEKLRLRLSGEQQRQMVRRETNNAEAYQFYLRGRYYWNRRSADGLKKAIVEFQQAVDRDPSYALGYSGLADCYIVLEEYAGTPATETLPKAQAAVERALQIDDSLVEARTSSAYLLHNQWRWAESDEEFRKAIALNPNYPTMHHWYSITFRPKRQFDEALREMKRAQELDPLSASIGNNVAMMYLLHNDTESAVAEFKKAIDLDPNFAPAHANLGHAYIKQKRYDEAMAEFQRSVDLSNRAGLLLSSLGYGHAVTGKRDEALQIAKELEDKYAKGESIGQYPARVYAGLGDKDQAFEWLEKDFRQRSGLLSMIPWWFTFDDLRSDPRYVDLIRRMNLPQ